MPGRSQRRSGQLPVVEKNAQLRPSECAKRARSRKSERGIHLQNRALRAGQPHKGAARNQGAQPLGSSGYLQPGGSRPRLRPIPLPAKPSLAAASLYPHPRTALAQRPDHATAAIFLQAPLFFSCLHEPTRVILRHIRKKNFSDEQFFLSFSTYSAGWLTRSWRRRWWRVFTARRAALVFFGNLRLQGEAVRAAWRRRWAWKA